MRKLVAGAGVVAVGLAATLAVASPASAAPRNEGAACIQAGISTLKDLGLLQAAAQKKVDYSTLANPTTGPIFTTLPTGSYLSLGQVVKLPDGKLVVTRFGHGKAGDVVYANPDGTSGTVPKLDPLRSRIGLAATSDGTLYEAFFFSKDGVKSGGIARIDLTGTEAEVIGGLKKPVGVLALGGELVVSDQVAGTILRAPVGSPDKQVVVAKVPEPDLLCAGPEGTFFTGGKTGSVRQVLGSGEVKELSGGFQDVRGVAYDGQKKRLFVADHDRNEADGITHHLRILPVD